MKKEKTNHDRLFGATKIPFEGPPMGTLRIREKIISIKMGCPVTVYIIELILDKSLRSILPMPDMGERCSGGFLNIAPISY